MTLKFVKFMFLLLLMQTSYTQSLPDKNFKPLGLHTDSSGHIEVLNEMISPQKFWNDYCKIGKPVIFKGFALNSPSFKLWTDEYLTERYGNLKVKVESKFEKENIPVGDRGLGQDSIKHFIETYKTDNKYMVTQLPDPMAKEVLVPNCILCGSYFKRIVEVDMWMSSGNTTSLLHRDAFNQINCLLKGRKEWVLIHPNYTQDLPVAVEIGDPAGGFTKIDVNSVDFEKFPEMKNIPWNSAKMSAGDCLFLPTQYWHQVRSYEDRNMAVSFLIARLKKYEDNGCPSDGSVPESKLLSEVPYVWKYDGVEEFQTMGNGDIYGIDKRFKYFCKENDGVITVESFLNMILESKEVRNYKGSLEIVGDYELSKNELRQLKRKASAMLNTIDKNSDGKFDCETELELLKENDFKNFVSIHERDQGNGVELEFYTIEFDDVETLLRKRDNWLKESFVKYYVYKLNGSKPGGEKVFSTLDENSDDIVDLFEIHSNLDKVYELFDRYQEGEFVEDRVREHKESIKDEL